MDALPDDLQSQLAQVDAKFPANLQDTPYDTQDLIWNGPFFGKGGPQLVRNPLTGDAQPMAPGTTPDHYLAAVNSIVEAKANARANVLRGWDAEQASSQALAKAWNVDPNAVAGQGPQAARGIIQGQVEGRKEALSNEQEARRQSIEQQHIDLTRADFQQNQARLQQEDAAKAQHQSDVNAALQNLPRMQEYLASLPSDKAMALAPGILAPLARVGSPIYETTLAAIATRANRDMLQQDADSRLRDQHMKAIGDAAKQLDEQYKPMFDDLAKTTPVKFGKVQDPTDPMKEKRTPLYDEAFEERLSQIQGAINRASSLDPTIGPASDQVLKRIRGLADKQEGLDALGEFSRRLSSSLRQILENHKAGMFGTPSDSSGSDAETSFFQSARRGGLANRIAQS